MIALNDTLINALTAQTALVKEIEDLYGMLEQHKEAALFCRYMIGTIKATGEYDQSALNSALAVQRAIASKIDKVYTQLAEAKDRATLYRAVVKSYQHD